MTAAKRLRVGLGALGVATLGYGVYGLFNESGIRDEAAVGEWLIGGVIGHDFLLAPVVFILGATAYRLTDARWRGRLAAVLLIGGSLTLISIPALLRQGLNRNQTVLPLDKYHEDADGYFWYAGRCDDMIKVSGVWVSPIEIERVLVEHPAVQEAAVVFRQDADELLKPAACVVLRNGASGGPQIAGELQQFVLERLPVYKRPHWIEFFDELPKTATGKVQRFRLRTPRG